jgi:hypothetical protein
MVIWALFDSETATVAEAFPEHEVYSFGIGSGTEHIHLDLSDFDTAKKELEKYPKPDVIFASPPCESWVLINVGSKRFYTKKHGKNFYWENKWTPFDFTKKQKEKRLNGINTAMTTAKIISYFKPRCWAIENGNNSMVFDYIRDFAKLAGIKNKCNYYSYGFDFLKRTIIYSNAMLILKNIQPKQKLLNVCEENRNNLDQFGIDKFLTYKERSKVPPLLYRDIMRQFQHGGQKTLFPMEEVT